MERRPAVPGRGQRGEPRRRDCDRVDTEEDPSQGGVVDLTDIRPAPRAVTRRPRGARRTETVGSYPLSDAHFTFPWWSIATRPGKLAHTSGPPGRPSQPSRPYLGTREGEAEQFLGSPRRRRSGPSTPRAVR